jgi:5'-3' exonuclease
MCILSGCDYLDNITGIGLVKAKKIMSKTQITDIELVILLQIFFKLYSLLFKIDS